MTELFRSTLLAALLMLAGAGPALAGKGAMAAQGGGEFNDTEIARGVVYMSNAAGANFPEPGNVFGNSSRK